VLNSATKSKLAFFVISKRRKTTLKSFIIGKEHQADAEKHKSLTVIQAYQHYNLNKI
jgi:hypothetical protein